jgi:hypothetical protein
LTSPDSVEPLISPANKRKVTVIKPAVHVRPTGSPHARDSNTIRL